MLRKSLPDGWVEGFDPHYGRQYYFHKPTRRSSWTKPEFPEENENNHMDIEASASPASSSASFRRSQFASNSNGSQTFVSQQQAVARFNDWLEIYSPEHGRTFFFNKITRESTWNDPRQSQHFQQQKQPSPSQRDHRAAMIRSEETPAGFLGAWESVGSDNSFKQPQDRPRSTPTAQQDVKSISPSTSSPVMTAPGHSPSASPSRTAPIPNSPMFAAAATTIPLGSASSMSGSFSKEKSFETKSGSEKRGQQNDNQLADELEMFARDLERQGHRVGNHANLLDKSSREEVNRLNAETSELAQTAEALLRSSQTNSFKERRGTKRLLSEESALSIWGSEPPKVLDVKRAMNEVKSGVKYVKEELKAQGEANEEASKLDAEGGYYTILGVSTNADLDAMKKAYRRGMIKCHPDKVPVEEKAAALDRANMLQNAYNCLSDPWERYLYDYFGLKRYLQNSKVIQCFKNYLLSGIEIRKHPRKGYSRKRALWISPDFEWIMTGKDRILEPSREELERLKGVRIKDIIEITRGITTEVFERTGVPKKQSRYFSIITNERTLDIEAESKERADFLVSRISLLVLDTQKNKKWLQRHFELKALREAAEVARKAMFDGGGYAPRPPQESASNGSSAARQPQENNPDAPGDARPS